MTLSLHSLQARTGLANKRSKRVGRGDSSGKGSYSGRGIKGQGSRSGAGGMRIKMLRRRLMVMPKLGGFQSLYTKAPVVNLDVLEKFFAPNAIVSPSTLLKFKLIPSAKYGAKILGQGKVSKPLNILSCELSGSAREKIIAAGGKIEEKKKKVGQKKAASKKKK